MRTSQMMKMTLNYFSSYSKSVLFVFFCCLFTLWSCAERQEKPAPVYEPFQQEPYSYKPEISDEKQLSEQTSKKIENTFKAEQPQPSSQVTEEEWSWPFDFDQQQNQKTVKPKASEKKLSPAIVALVAQADASRQSGDLESAGVTLERALRIEPRNALLTYKLAKVRLLQSKPKLAENLAKKAALLADQDRALKKQAWLLISEARKLQDNLHGAKEAQRKAEKI